MTERSIFTVNARKDGTMTCEIHLHDRERLEEIYAALKAEMPEGCTITIRPTDCSGGCVLEDGQ